MKPQKKHSSKKYFGVGAFYLSIVMLCMFFLCSCVPVLVGTGVVAGYTLSNDSAIGEVKCDYRTLWDVTMDKLETMKAEISNADESKGLIKAKVYDTDVTIKINMINSSVQKLKIAARKYLLPKPQTAQKIFVKIIQDLE